MKLSSSSLVFAFLGPSIGCLLTGCATPLAKVSTPHAVAAQGRVFGGQQPISGATIQLYAVGTSGDGSAAGPLIASTVTTSDGSGLPNSNANVGNLANTLPAGYFTITGAYLCPSSSTQVYIVATGGNPGLSASTNNSAQALTAALGNCGSLTPSTTLSINEVTTVGAVAALYPYMTSYAAIGSGSADAPALAAAFTTAAKYANVTTGTAPGPALPSGYYASTTAVNTLADVLSSCINSTGGAANDGSSCGTLFYDTTPAGGTPPADTIAALLQVLKNPTANATPIFGLQSSTPPFEPTLTAPPSSFALPIVAIPAAPAISPNGGTYNSSQPVTIADADTSATIYYTLDGTTPTVASTLYQGPFSLGMTTTVKVIAVDSGAVSATGSAAFTFSGNFPNVSLTPVSVVQSSTGPANITATSTANGSTVTFSLSGASGSFSPATCVIANGACSVSYVPTGTLAVGAFTNALVASFSSTGSYSATSAASTLTVKAGVTSATLMPLINFTGMYGSYPGSAPYGQLLLASDGNFYGTTSAGGANNLGVIFRMTPTGVYTVVRSFSVADGDTPMAGLIEGSDGNFYGTTSSGGLISNAPAQNGTVFQLTPAGTYNLLHTFQGGSDGTNPMAPLTQATDNNFYGTTTQAYNATSSYAGSGDEYVVSPAGAYSVNTNFNSGLGMLHAGFLDIATDKYGDGYVETIEFAGDGLSENAMLNVDGSLDTSSYCDGQYSYGEVIEAPPNNSGATYALYTTVAQGGVNGYGAVCEPRGNSGTSFASADLYSFTGGNDGSTPQAAMVMGSDGNYYGTATAAGANSAGTAYYVTPAGGFTLLHAFGAGATDGNVPAATLLQGADGNFYGSTQTGGASGYGMIYKLVPNITLPGPVSLTAPATVAPGAAFTLGYSVANAYSNTVERCFANNNAGDTTVWTGVMVSSPTVTNLALTAPATAGTYTYALTCGGTESGFATISVQ